MEKVTIAERLNALREEMRREHIDAFIFPSTDPHHGEYVPDHWKGREFISGFDGSAGTAVVTANEAALWTDSRYFIAAAQQLEGTEFVLMKERVEGTPSIEEWLGKKLALVNGTVVGVDGMVNSKNEVETLTKALRRRGGITLRTNYDPLRVIWRDRPSIPLSPVVEHPIALAGESRVSKIKRIREELKVRRVRGLFVSELDEIAWTLNIRGIDVHCNPVAVAYLLITMCDVVLFVDLRKLSEELIERLRMDGVKVEDYTEVKNCLQRYDEYGILMDANVTAYTLYNSVNCQEKIDAPSPIQMMKAIKNETEINGFRQAMLKDGVALVKFLKWLKPAVAEGGQTEISIDRKLTQLRAKQKGFKGLSFDTIAGYEAHGAIVHYEATKESNALLEPRGLLLLDSGAQYEDGTTDITRTIALGEVSEKQRHIYTLVLKGNIQLAMLKFPKGATGTQLDALARKDLWREGLNYMHGTGHGVGAYLNVHEGPHQIRMEWRPAPIYEGMTVTDEPGIYVEGEFGVRIENTMLITPYLKTAFGEFLGMEPLTLCPIDTEPIIVEMLTDEELQWLNDYHAHVNEALAPLLDEEHRQWLKEMTNPLKKDEA